MATLVLTSSATLWGTGWTGTAPGPGIDFFNDFASSSIDSLVWTSFAAKSIVYLDVKPTSSARAATNPSYVFALYVAKYPPGGFQIGNAATTQVGFMIAGKYARLTS